MFANENQMDASKSCFVRCVNKGKFQQKKAEDEVMIDGAKSLGVAAASSAAPVAGGGHVEGMFSRYLGLSYD